MTFQTQLLEILDFNKTLTNQLVAEMPIILKDPSQI